MNGTREFWAVDSDDNPIGVRNNTNIVNAEEFKYFTNITNVQNGIFHSCINLSVVGLPPNLLVQDNDLFYNCPAIRTVVLTDLETYLKASVGKTGCPFMAAHNNKIDVDLCMNTSSNVVKDLVMPAIELKQANHFSGATIETLTFVPENKKVPDGMFSYCKHLKSITFPEGIGSIGSYAFINNSSLNSLILPSTINNIGYRSFQDCGITSIVIKATTPPNCLQPFYGNSFTLYVPDESVSAYTGVDGYGSNIKPISEYPDQDALN